MFRDIRYAWRSLRRKPVFLTMAVATFALGIGATTAIFSLFYQVLLRELPVRDPEQLVVLHLDTRLPGWTWSDNFETVFSQPMYRNLRDGSGTVLTGLIARSSAAVDVMRNRQTERAQVETVSGNFFAVLGAQPFAGRLLATQDDTAPGSNDVAVLAYQFWQKHYGTLSVLNEKVLVNGHPITVIGIAAADFRSVLSGQTPDIYMPISMAGVTNPAFSGPNFDGLDKPDVHWLTVIGRLRPGVTPAQAGAALNPRLIALLRDQLGSLKIKSARSQQRILGARLALHPAATGLNSLEKTWRKPLLVLCAAAGGLLLIACSNLAGLLMVRASARQREIALRRAVGASRSQIIRQLLVESVLLAMLGSALGVALSLVLTRGILQVLPPDLTGGWVGSALDWRVLGVTLLISLVSGIAFGLFPAWQASGDQTGFTLKEQSRSLASSTGETNWRRGFVVLEIALCVILLAGAGLFSKSLGKLLDHNPGFHSENLLTFSLDPALDHYSSAQAMNLYRQVGDRLSQSPGVSAVSFAQFAPYSNSDASTNVSVEGFHPSEDEDTNSSINPVGPGFFHALGVPLLAGREFTESDNLTSQKVAIVNQAFAKRFLHGRNPVGVRMSRGNGVPLDVLIVGYVADSQFANVREPAKPFYFTPFAQTGRLTDPATQSAFLVRTQGMDPNLPSAVRSLVRSLDAALPVTSMERMQVQIQNSVYQDRALAVITAASGILALVLASLGLYGVIAYAVSRRTAEIGIRIALGAERSSVVSLVLQEVLWLVAIGAAIGVATGLAFSRALASQLFGVQATDATVFAASVGLLLAVSIVAAAAPTLRATRIDPMQALRME